MATTAENLTNYSVQLALATQLGAKKTRTISDVLTNVAVGYMATEDSDDTAELTKFNSYVEALAGLTTATLTDSYLTAKTSTNELIADVNAG